MDFMNKILAEQNAFAQLVISKRTTNLSKFQESIKSAEIYKYSSQPLNPITDQNPEDYLISNLYEFSDVLPSNTLFNYIPIILPTSPDFRFLILNNLNNLIDSNAKSLTNLKVLESTNSPINMNHSRSNSSGPSKPLLTDITTTATTKNTSASNSVNIEDLNSINYILTKINLPALLAIYQSDGTTVASDSRNLYDYLVSEVDAAQRLSFDDVSAGLTNDNISLGTVICWMTYVFVTSLGNNYHTITPTQKTKIASTLATSALPFV